MSSNINIKRICKFCNKEFTARTTVTQCCSDHCSKRYYKLKKKGEKIEKSNQETLKVFSLPLESLKVKEFLSVAEASKLLGVSKRTLYRLMEKGELKFAKIGKRTIIKRTELDNFFNK
jgi:excisionase family DNA binding protein